MSPSRPGQVFPLPKPETRMIPLPNVAGPKKMFQGMVPPLSLTIVILVESNCPTIAAELLVGSYNWMVFIKLPLLLLPKM